MSRTLRAARNSHSGYKSYFFKLLGLSGTQPRMSGLCFTASNKERLDASQSKNRVVQRSVVPEIYCEEHI